MQRSLRRKMEKIDIDNLPEILTIKEVANLLRISPLTVKRWGVKEKLKPIRINKRGDRRYRREEILEFLKQRNQTNG